MICPQCSSEETEVINSRNAHKSVRRRRQCSTCSYRFTTFERVERPRILVVKKDQRREPFEREKIVFGILRACEKRPVSREQIDTLADAIDCKLHDLDRPEISSQEIGELVSESLRDLDPVAFVRFASVYREFEDVSSFAQVIEMLD